VTVPLTEKKMLELAYRRLGELLRQPVDHPQEEMSFWDSGIDGLATVGEKTFAIQVKNSGRLSAVNDGILSLKKSASDFIPILVVPYMTAAGSERCHQAEMPWLDLSGNASIHLDGVTIEIEGKPNAYPQRGRPASVFAPKSARISRWLLMHPDEFFSQRDLAKCTDMDEGFTSRIVTQMEDQHLVERDRKGRIRPRDPALLLEAWSEEYDFFKHQVIRGHISTRSSEQLLQKLAETLKGLKYAVTGLAAAWLLDGFAGFRLVTLYGNKEVFEALQSQLHFRQEERGANVWLVHPNDEGVFHGSGEQQNVFHVHPVQVWLDLKSQPERASEAAAHLRPSLDLGVRGARAR